MKRTEDSTGREIASELFTPGYLSRASHRATRRRSPWNFLLIATVLVSIGFSTLVLVRLADLWIQWRGSQPVFSPEAPEWKRIVVVCGALVVGFPVGMVIGNLLLWLVPAARRALDREAVGHPGSDYRTAQRHLTYMSKKMLALYKKLIGGI